MTSVLANPLSPLFETSIAQTISLDLEQHRDRVTSTSVDDEVFDSNQDIAFTLKDALVFPVPEEIKLSKNREQDIVDYWESFLYKDPLFSYANSSEQKISVLEFNQSSSTVNTSTSLSTGQGFQIIPLLSLSEFNS
jgi:hypothetical protein